MRSVLGVVLLVVCVQYALCCGRGKGKPGLVGPTGNVIQRLVGQDIQTAPFAGSGDTPGTCDQLACNFDDSSCCYDNAKSPVDQLSWVQASGTPEDPKMQSTFGTAEKPDGDFLIVASDTAGTDAQTAQFYSCPIECAQGDITVKAKHWQSKGVKLIQVCTETDPEGPPENCEDLPTTNGAQDEVTLSGVQSPARVVIQAVGFTDLLGSVAMIDDIEVTCDPCTTTPGATEGPTSPGATSPAAGAAPCEIQCDFEQGNLCSYTVASSGGTASKNWETQSAPFENRLTGIPTAASGSNKFASTYMKASQSEKSTMVVTSNFDSPYVVQYDFYKATHGIDLQACCGDESNCKVATTGDVQVADYKEWKTATLECDANTKQVLFVAKNTDGSSEGAVGVDNIKLLKQDQSAAC